MTSSQTEYNLVEIKVPIYCEWTFEKQLSDISDAQSTFFNYVNRLMNQTNFFTSQKYSVPGFPGIKYYIRIYREESLWVYFEVETEYDKYDFDANFTFAITDCEPKHIVHNFNNDTDEGIIKYFEMSACLEDCSGCLLCTAKKIAFRVEGTFTVKHVGNLLSSLTLSDKIKLLFYEDLWENKDTKDFGIVVEGQEIRVHKSILEENSTVFARMFDCDNWKETMENKITIPDFTFITVEFAIRAFYGYYMILKNKEEYLSAFQFADKYDMEKLSQAIKGIMDFTPYNVVEYAKFFLQNNVIELVNSCIDYIFSCSQYSIAIKDIELLDAEINAIIVNRILVSPVIKKNPKVEHRSFNYEIADDKS